MAKDETREQDTTATEPESQREPATEPEDGGEPASDPEEEREPTTELLGEVDRLGRRLGEALFRAWDSDERKRAEQQLGDGLQQVADEVQRLGGGLSEKPGVKDLKRGAGAVGRELSGGVLSGLRLLNRELDRALAEERVDAEDGDEQPPTEGDESGDGEDADDDDLK